MAAELVHLDGHIVDSLTLSKVLDIILREGAQYEIRSFQIGSTRFNASHAEILVSADSAVKLELVLHLIGQHGAVRVSGEAITAASPADGVFPDGFYATTNLETAVRVKGEWTRVPDIEMDCGLVLDGGVDGAAVRCVPMHRVKRGDAVLVGDAGVRVTPLARREAGDAFAFMGSDVSTERPKELVVRAIATAMLAAHAEGSRVLFVGGPAVLHTGAGHYLEAIIRAGHIDVLFAGNALATHDIEHSLYGTSLGIDTATGSGSAHGHEHHLRAINTIRRVGSIRKAVEVGVLKTGVMHACITCGIDVVLAGSIRDDGPLPDVITDSVQAQDAMREGVRGVGVALMVATTLHSVATGNLLPASVRTLCVDSDADTVIKLMDRGTHQAFGLVTDCEFFLKELAANLPGAEAAA